MSIDIGSIEVVDTGIQRLMDNANRLGLILPPAEIHTTQTQLTDLDSGSSEINIVHHSSFELKS